MKKIVTVSLMIAVIFILCGCGSKSDSYEFLTYTVPAGYVQDGSISHPFYSSDDGYSFGITIEHASTDLADVTDVLTIDEVLQGRLDSSVSVIDDVLVDDVTAKQYWNYDEDTNLADLNIAFIHGDSIVTLIAYSYNDEIPDPVMEDFSSFVNSVQITD